MNLAPRITASQRRLLMSLAVLTLLLGAGGLWFLQTQRDVLREDAESELLAIGRMKADEITLWRASRLASARVIAHSPLFAKLAARWIASPTPDLEAELRSVLEIYQTSYGFDDVSLVSPGGQVLISLMGPAHGPYDDEAHDALKQAAATGRPALTDLHLSPGDSTPHIGAVAPILTRDENGGRVIGAVILRMNADKYLFPLVQSWPLPHRTAETLLVRRDGDHVLFLNNVRHQTNTALRLRLPLTATNLPAVAAVTGRTGIFEGRDYRGQEVVSALIPLSDSPWFMVAKVDKAEAFARLRARSMLILGMVFGVLATMLAVMMTLWQRAQRARFQAAYRASVEKQALIAHFEYLVRYANDIILLTDERHRIVEANDRACAAYGYTRGELIGQPVSRLVPPEDAGGLRQRIAAIEAGEHQLYETRHQRKDGSTFPVEISAQAITIEGQPFIQGIIRDITERRQAEARLRESEERLAATLRSIGDGVISTDAAGRVTGLNLISEELTGWTTDEARGRPVGEVFRIVNAHTRQPAPCPITRVLQEGTIVGLANHTVLIGRDGREYQIADSAAPIRAADGTILGVVMVFRDVTREYQLQEDIRASERRYRLLFEHMTTGFALHEIIADEQGRPRDYRFLEVNPAFEKVTGLKPDALIGRTVLEALPGTEPQWIETYGRVAASGEPALFEQYSKVLDRHYEVLAYSPQPGQFATVVRDITKRKQAEVELRADEARLEGLLRIAQHPVVGIQELLDYALEEAIQLTESRIGYIYYYSEEKQEFTLNTWSREVLPACTVQEPQTVYALEKTGIWGEAVRQRRAIILNDFDAAHPQKQGMPEGHVPLRRFMTVPVFVNGAIVAVVGVANKEAEYDSRDERQLTLMMDFVWKMAENRRAADHLRLQDSALQAAANGVIITNVQGDIIWTNPAFCKMTGYEPAEVLGKNPRLLQSGKQDRAFYENLWATILAGRVWSGEMINRRKDGTFYHEETTITPIRDAAGTITQFIGIKQDVTERHNLHLQLLQSQKIESVGRLAGGVAHDFNNLLQVILGFTELLLDQPDGSCPGREDLIEIKKAADRARDLTRQLLAFSRKQMLEPKVIDLNDQVEHNQRMLRRLLGEDILLETRLRPHLWAVRADPGQMDQVIVNLAVNARDAMPAGGRLTIATENVQYGPRDVEAHPEMRAGRFVCLTIADTGMGMAPEILEHLFEPFFTTKELGKGSGLGLATIYGIVKQHDGWIHAYSEPGRGSAFKVYLPALGEETPDVQMANDTAAAPPEGRGQRILVVEDEDGVRHFTVHTLKAHGYEVLSVASAAAALEQFRQNPAAYDLAMVDMVLPDGNGLKLVEQFCALNPALRVVLNSGYTDEKSRWPEVQQRKLAFIQKPYPVDVLLRTVAAALAAAPSP